LPEFEHIDIEEGKEEEADMKEPLARFFWIPLLECERGLFLARKSL
jgi:hypothetical protein